MATRVGFFASLKKSFSNVPIDSANNNAIDTSSFLEASESLITLFGTSQQTPQTSTSHSTDHTCPHQISSAP